MPRLATLALAALASTGAALRAPSPGGLQDLAAYPKYEVVFLNDHPLSASDAARCRAEGLVNDDDFLVIHPRSRVGIEAEAAEREEREEREDREDEGEKEDDSTETESDTEPEPAPESGANDKNLELMTLHYTHQGETGSHAYLCALPSSNRTAEQTASAAEPHDEPEPDAAASWLALSHLDGQCLYVRHRWFTYAYCHNKYIRQFKAQEMTAPSPPEGHTPREDPAYDAYTLGYAHPPKRKAKRKDKEDSQALAPEQTATFGVGPASRYLVQRWTDGTRCDKTGAPREVEVQVHCSMTSGDAIYMVKEVEICKYIVVIHSPHLCSLPGFRPQTADDVVSVPIRCREIISDEDFARWEAEPEEQRKLAATGDLLRLPERPEEVEQKQFTFKAKDGKDDATEEIEVDDELVKRLEDILTKAFGGGDLGDLGVDVQVKHFGEIGDIGDEFVPKKVEDGAADDKVPAHGDPPVLFLRFDEEDGQIKPAEGDGLDPAESRRAMLERLQKMIAEELGQGEAAEPEGDGAKDARRAKDEL